MSQFASDSIFWIDIEKVKPNPYQPRHEFDEDRLRDLSESIRQYGVLQPLVVSRGEIVKPDGGIAVEYELISGERRLRASKIAGLSQVPAIIRSGTEDTKLKLELAIIENLQREDLNPVDRARAFFRLADEFSFKHVEIAAKVGKSREYVSNSLRILALPKEIIDALSAGKISEGHTRPLLMLSDRPEEQTVLFQEIMIKHLTVREAENISRRVAYDRVRKKPIDPQTIEMEEKLTESLGTRVHIERKETGGKILIDFFSNEDLDGILTLLRSNGAKKPNEMIQKYLASKVQPQAGTALPAPVVSEAPAEVIPLGGGENDVPKAEEVKAEEDTELYSVKNFSI